MERKLPLKPRYPVHVYDRAQQLLNEPVKGPMSAAGIAERLVAEADELGEHLPDARTIRNWIKNAWIVAEDLDEPWTFAKGRAEDGALVLPAARWLAQKPRPRWAQNPRGGLTVRQARALVRVRLADPGLNLEMAVGVARMASESDPEAEQHAHAVLVHEPWANGGASLFRLILDGRVSTAALKIGLEQAYIEWYVKQDMAKRGIGKPKEVRGGR